MADEAQAPAKLGGMTMKHWLLGGLAVIVLLAIVLPKDPAPERATAAAGAFANPPAKIGDSFAFSAVAAPGATPASLEAAAKAFCNNGERLCQVMVWRDAAVVPKAVPLLDREAAALAFQYSLNRLTGFEQSTWDCRVWPGKPDQCRAT